MTLRRKLLISLLAVVALVALTWLTLHTSAVQQTAFESVLARVEAETGVRIEIDDPRLRLWPARLTGSNLRASIDGRVVVSASLIEARWTWFSLLAETRRIDGVRIAGIELDLYDPPPLPARTTEPTEEAVDPWHALEIGELEIADGGGRAGVAEHRVLLSGLEMTAGLEDGVAHIGLSVSRLELVRIDRELRLEDLRARLQASESGLVLEEAVIGGGDIRGGVNGDLTGYEPLAGDLDFRIAAAISDLAEWWDPNLVSGLAPQGDLQLEGSFTVGPEGEIRADAVHVGDPISIAGYRLEELEAGYLDGVPEIRLGGSTWGRAAVSVASNGVASVDAEFADAPVERVLGFVAPEIAGWIPGPISLDGGIDGTVAYPVSLDTLSGRVDLRADTTRGRVAIRGEGAGANWVVDEVTVDLDGISLVASGKHRDGAKITGDLDLRIDAPDRAAELVSAWIPVTSGVEVGGGPLSAGLEISGDRRALEYQGRLLWEDPEIDGIELGMIDAVFEGDLDTASWNGVIEAPGMEIGLDGTTKLDDVSIHGSWDIEIDDIVRAASLVEGLPVSSEDDLSGVLVSDGSFHVSQVGWTLQGEIEGSDLSWRGWTGEALGAAFSADAGSVEISELTAEILGGTLSGSGAVELGGLDAPVTAMVNWRDLDLLRAPVEIPNAAAGLSSGEIEIAGTLSEPTGRLEIRWQAGDDRDIPDLRLIAGLDEGVVSFATDEFSVRAGAFSAEGVLPIGLVPRPDWLWAGAPDGGLRIRAHGRDLSSAGVLELLGQPQRNMGLTGDLELDAEWHPDRPEDTRVLGELRNVRFIHEGGEIVADRPAVIEIAGSRLRVEPVVFEGRVSRVSVEADADLVTRSLNGRIDAILSPGFGRNIPYPVQIHEPVNVSAELVGTLDRPRFSFRASHPGGALVFRDPPLRIRDVVLDAEYVDGALWINDGRARVNQGTMEIGGGWDPVSRQGIVAEFENVVVFVGGILSQWSGALAVEPEPGRLAKVVGEVNLVAGLWDQNVSLGSALFGSGAIGPAPDDPLKEITLDLDVRGRGIVRVENNLGRFDARWDVLRVTGQAAQPRFLGEIKIDPGGRFSLAGQQVKVRRGSLLFTGDPQVDPIVEIVPESDFAAFTQGESQLDTTAMAAQGLVGGLAGALGFENETLQPAEISVDLERESSSQLKFGQRLSHNVALFFATNTTDVQDRTSMLQFWNLPGLHGLAIQGYQQTRDDELGANLIQRFQWGGSSIWEDRPTIRKLKLTGDWPLSKRSLRRAAGFRRGRPFDPFLEFVAEVRMERELAQNGYQEARVRGRSEESNHAWTMIFECEPGPRQTVEFLGDAPPKRVRGEVTALYRHPPLEDLGFRNMASLLNRHLDVEGFPDASVVVERRGDVVVAEISNESRTQLSGPILDGVPNHVAAEVALRLGNPGDLALLAEDTERATRILAKVLVDLGYREAEVRSVETREVEPGAAEIFAVVDLGTQAIVGELVLRGSDPLRLTEDEAFSLKAGNPLDRLSVNLAASRVRAGYDAAGYSNAQVRGSAAQADDGTWTVTIRIEPGIQRVLTGVEVNGLKHTSKRSIVSGMTIDEGEILKNSDLDTTAVRVANFAPIERVDVRTVPEGANGAKVELDVYEKERWTAEVGGGWSTERGIQARVGLRDDNLFGRGFGLNLRGRWDRVEWLGFLVASLPPLPGKRLSFASTIGFSRGEPPTRDPEDFLQDETVWSIEGTRWLGGGELAAGTAGEQVTAYYRFTRTHTYHKVPPNPDEWWDYPVDDLTHIGLLGARYARDRFDSPFDPTRGYGVFLDGGYSADLLGSDFEYWTALANGTTAVRVFGSTTWVQSARVGIAEPLHGRKLIEHVKFFAGGQGSIRGFDRNTVGPVTYGFDDGWVPAGGGALLILNEELRIPIKGGFRAAVFADIGQVWESWGHVEGNLRLSVGAGVGVRWATPIGPLWADVAWPVANPILIFSGVDPDDPLLPPPPESGITSTGPKFYIGIGRPF